MVKFERLGDVIGTLRRSMATSFAITEAQVCIVLIVPGTDDTCREETRSDWRLKASMIENIDESSELAPGSFNGLVIMMNIGGGFGFGCLTKFVAWP